MTIPQEQVDSLLNPLLSRLREKQISDKDSADYWALRAAENFPLPGEHRDRGIFSVYLLNLVHMRPGQGTFQPAGVLHAYLEGVNVELMANSDNVLRGGLTTKHVDVPELLNILTFEGGTPEVFDGTPGKRGGTGLSHARGRVRVTPHRASCAWPICGRGYLRSEGAAGVAWLRKADGREPGHIAWARIDRSRPSGTEFVLETRADDLVVFQAGLPLHARGAA